MMSFVKLYRSPETQWLFEHDPLAFLLLTQIALRARWHHELNGLAPGEALIGDHDSCGLTRRQYRTRVERLAKSGLIAIRPTAKGTIVQLISTAIFDINEQPNECLTNEVNGKNRPANRPTVFRERNGAERPTERPRSGQQAANKRPLTKKDRRKEGKNDDTRVRVRTAQREQQRDQSSSSNFLSLEDAMKDRRWWEFARFCKSKGGTPTKKGFETWCKKNPLPARKKSFAEIHRERVKRMMSDEKSSVCPKSDRQRSEMTREIPYEEAKRRSIEKADRENGLVK